MENKNTVELKQGEIISIFPAKQKVEKNNVRMLIFYFLSLYLKNKK